MIVSTGHNEARHSSLPRAAVSGSEESGRAQGRTGRQRTAPPSRSLPRRRPGARWRCGPAGPARSALVPGGRARRAHERRGWRTENEEAQAARNAPRAAPARTRVESRASAGRRRGGPPRSADCARGHGFGLGFDLANTPNIVGNATGPLSAPRRPPMQAGLAHRSVLSRAVDSGRRVPTQTVLHGDADPAS